MNIKKLIKGNLFFNNINVWELLQKRNRLACREEEKLIKEKSEETTKKDSSTPFIRNFKKDLTKNSHFLSYYLRSPLSYYLWSTLSYYRRSTSLLGLPLILFNSSPRGPVKLKMILNVPS